MAWEKVKLGDVCKIGDGAHASLKRQSHGIPYLTAKNLTRNGIDVQNLDFIDETTYNKHFKESSIALTRPQKDDILYSIIGSIGGVYLVKDEKIGISSSVAIFRSNPSTLISKYLYYYLKSSLFDSQIQAIKGGVAQGFMSLSKLSSIEISYPLEIKTQQKIADILSAYDNLIENNQKQIKLLEEAAQRLYKQWFIDLRYPGYETTKIVDGLPKGWRTGIVGEIAEFKRGKVITKAQVAEGNIPVVAGGLEPAYYHNTANTTAPVITVSGSGANAGFAQLYNENVFASDCSFADINTTPYVYFVYCLLKDKKTELDSLQKGAAQPHVYAKDINALATLIPPEEMLKLYTKYASPYFEKAKALKKQIKNLTQSRDRLLPKLMNGELEV